MTVLIQVDQAAAPPGVPGQAREDLVTGVGVTLAAIGGPFLAYQWSIVSKPIDITVPVEASSLLGSATANTTTLSPIDVEGTYLVQVSVDSGNGLGAGAGDVARITFYAGTPLATDPTELPRRGMAAFESTEHNVPDAVQPLGNTQGWSREWYRWFAAIRRSVTLTLTATINAVANSLAQRNSLGELVASGFVTGPGFWKAASVQTVDATLTAILQIPFSDDAVLTGDVEFLATSTAGIFEAASVGAIEVTTAGVLASVGAPLVTSFTTFVGPQPTVSISYAANVLTFEVTGLPLTVINWMIRVDSLINLTP